jgi:hypothetical protein
MDNVTFHEWIEKGIAENWVSAPYCETHDGCPPDDMEILDKLWNEYEGDHCWPVLTLRHGRSNE